ncbi:hypothetical protein WICMUC_005370 [Wickerhamomyces mucosus]|uniref:RRM Nup35-type domain-containing protein n=1 Tax=Wickerhamomyces mucosus TaxID=1378264 RepID=A0A9P8T5I6_9ASCO|nr:hypothetical protein WICMUC_005370 [Wickerhamomyces mucosus]
MAAFRKDNQEYSKDLFGGYYQKNFDILQKSETPTQSRFIHLKSLGKGDTPDKSSDDLNISSISSPRRTPSQQKTFDAFNGSESLSLAAINQRFSSLESQQNQTQTTATSASDQPKQLTSKTINISNQPSWFNNPRRRNNTSQVIKRENYDEIDADSSFLIKQKSTSTNASQGFKTLSFGTRRNNQELPHVSTFSDELPPVKTLSDLQREDNTEEITIKNSNGSLSTNIDSNSNFSGSIEIPNSINNVQSISNNLRDDSSTGTRDLDNLFQPPKRSQADLVFQNQQKNSFNPSHDNESAVLVFGYPETISNSVIKHFAKFGTILEDFEVTRIDPLFSRAKPKTYPIYTGNGWIKLTYDNKASSFRALEENGSVFHGSTIACIPYSKQAIEKISSLSNVLDLDQSASLNFISQASNNDSELVQNYANMKSKITLKNDDKIFQRSTREKNFYSDNNTESKETDSIINRVSNWFFGWDDL